LWFFFFFEIGSCELFARAGFELWSSDLCLLSSKDYRCEPPAPSSILFLEFIEF
jgi:hypothetical protein